MASRDRNEGNVPVECKVGKGMLWICAQEDITDAFLAMFNESDQVITCKDGLVGSVGDACRRRGMPEPLLFNVGFATERKRDLPFLLKQVKVMMDRGQSVILHCHAGVHRAAHVLCLLLMFLLGITYAEARRQLECVRTVELDGILESRCT